MKKVGPYLRGLINFWPSIGASLNRPVVPIAPKPKAVGYVKTSCLAGMKVDRLEQAQPEIGHWLQEVADVRTIRGLAGTPRDRFLTEMNALSPCGKVPVTNLRLQTRIVNASSPIIVNNRRYELVNTEPGTQVEIMEGPETITVYHHGQKLCTKNKATDE